MADPDRQTPGDVFEMQPEQEDNQYQSRNEAPPDEADPTQHNESHDKSLDKSLILEGQSQDNNSPNPEDKASRASSKTRVPRLNSRAAFTRTPSHIITPRHGEGELPTAAETGILITELEASDDEKEEPDILVVTPPLNVETQDEEEKADVPEKEEEEEEVGEDDQEFSIDNDPVPMETVEVKVTDEDYDTDLEDDVEEDPDQLKDYYMSVCEQLGLVPVEYFLRHIRSNNIRMRYRGLGAEATRAIALSLKDSITLEKLDMAGNWIGPDGARFMGRLLEENDYLTDITMSDNKIGSVGCLHLVKMIETNGGLRRLDLAGNEMDDKCAEALALAIENNKYLNELNLSHNSFTEKGAEFIGTAIGANETMEILDLRWNHLREKGGILVAAGIKENVRLKVCNLSWNGLDLRGGLAMADAMTVNQSLLELDMSGNRLNLEVTTKFAKVITTNDTIRVLRMGNNLITSAGAIALASSINNTGNCEMEELDLTDVPVEYEFLRTLEDIKTNRPNFKARYGPVMRAGNTIDDLSKPGLDLDRMKKEPVVILKEHIVVNDMRLLDILQRMDESGSLCVTAEDFITALEELAVPYDKKRLRESVDKFANTATGKIYFGSFVSDSYEKKKVIEDAPETDAE